MQTRYLLLALAISACAPSADRLKEQQQFAADIDALGQEKQTGYFACRFVRHLWHCREEVWQSHAKPHAPAGNQREFLQRYIDAAERSGAHNILAAEGLPCGEVVSLDNFFWREGQEVICSQGERYQILRDSQDWHVKVLQEGA